VVGVAENKPSLQKNDRFADESFALAALPRREFGAHKWSVGGLIVVAGGPGYIGAAALSALAAGRAGAGIVNVAIPRGAMGAVAAIVPEAAFIPLSEGDLDTSVRRARESIAAKLERSAAMLVGPGLGDDDYAEGLLGSIFGKHAAKRIADFGFRNRLSVDDAESSNIETALVGGEKPAVVDADGLNWLAKQPEWWTTVAPRSLVLTPHVGEMSRLTGLETEEICKDPMSAARRAAADWNQIVVLKYGFTVATDGERAILAEDAPVSLASAGTGDVFAGIIGAFLAQGVPALDAAGLAIYLGTRAARRIEARVGILGLIASDLPAAVAEEIADLERRRDENGG
jgi:hydroxyethylthiazole kinase-like uncharacterized protein yjeF